MSICQFPTLADLIRDGYEINQKYLSNWANCRETDEVVALAIHAIADESRPAQAIWEAPTEDEWDQVIMAVQNYINNGEYPAQDEYYWCEEPFYLGDDE
jgi:hypothetical protein